METDLQGVARNVCALIDPENDQGAWRWMVYQMADHLEQCERLLEEAGIPSPGPELRPSTRMIVDENGGLRERTEEEEL